MKAIKKNSYVGTLLTLLAISFAISSCNNRGPKYNRPADDEDTIIETPSSPSVSWEEKLNKVTPGMTEDEVIEILGKPRDRQYDSYTGAVRLYYLSNYKVVIRDGVVHHWEKMYD